jgi:hypothetical protein
MSYPTPLPARASDTGPDVYARDEDPLPNDGDARCGSCGALCETLIHLDSWNFLACPACAAECAAVESAEMAADECACRFAGDQADASECPRHGMSAAAARKILTYHEFPPIPVRAFDWSAVVDGDEENGPYGWGATKAAAVADLVEQLDEAAAELAEEAAFLALGATVSEATTPAVGDTTVVERWEGGRWVTRTLVWNGAGYVARKAVGSETTLGAVAGRKTLGA